MSCPNFRLFALTIESYWAVRCGAPGFELISPTELTEELPWWAAPRPILEPECPEP